jgi:hypothetical protein
MPVRPIGASTKLTVAKRCFGSMPDLVGQLGPMGSGEQSIYNLLIKGL